MMDVTPVVVLVTAGSEEEGQQIGRALVEEGWAACVTLVPSVRSIFRWEGKICEEGEVLLLIKSRRDVLDRIVERVKALHSYEVPEVIALSVVGGSEAYLKWVEEAVGVPDP